MEIAADTGNVLNKDFQVSRGVQKQDGEFLRQQTEAVWTAVKRACLLDDFRPKPGPLCDWCGYHAYCPAWGGDPTLARPAPAVGGTGIAEMAPAQLFELPLAANR